MNTQDNKAEYKPYFSTLVGEFTGMLKGFLHYPLPVDVKSRVNEKIEQLESITPEYILSKDYATQLQLNKQVGEMFEGSKPLTSFESDVLNETLKKQAKTHRYNEIESKQVGAVWAKARYNFEQGLRDIFADAGNYDYKGLPHTHVMINEILKLYDETQSTPTISLGNEKWIDVANEPEKDGYYLCYNPNSNTYSQTDVLRYSKYNNSWYWGSDCFHPTHYQPLPKPPSTALQQKSADNKK